MDEKFMGTAKAAGKWKTSQSTVSKLCREGKISGAVKDEKGKWQIPISAEIPAECIKPPETKENLWEKLNSVNENIIVGVIAAVLIILLFAAVGYNNIIYWLSSPVIWKDQDYITIQLVDKDEDEDYGRMELQFAVYNRSSDPISHYEFYVTTGVNALRVSSSGNPVLEPHSTAIVKESFMMGAKENFIRQ